MPGLEPDEIKERIRAGDEPGAAGEDARAWYEWRNLYLVNEDECSGPGESLASPHIEFLQKLADLSAALDAEAAIAAVIDFFNEHLNAGDFPACDRALADADLFSLPAEVALAFLSMTLAAKDQLKEREAFYQYLEQWLELQEGPSQARELLQGLD
jgi:hypothetical protein